MNNIVFIGPDHRNHRGGIGAVLDVYSKHISPFRIIPTYVTKPFYHQLYVYISALIKLFWICATDPSVKILHIHHASKGSFLRKSILFAIGKLFRKKIILHIHGARFHLFYQRSRLMKPIIKRTLESADAVVCLSGKWKEFFETNFNIKRIEIINNIVEEADSRAVSSSNDVINFLFLGQIGERKGIFDLLEVISKNRENYEGRIHLTIGGIGEVDRLLKTVEDKKLKDLVSFAGWVKGTKKSELLSSCDVYILPSYDEGLPISILEAMSHGKPIVSTYVGGIPEIVKPGENGWLFNSGDLEALNDTLMDVLRKQPELKVYGDNSKKISREYTPPRVLNSLETLYGKM